MCLSPTKSKDSGSHRIGCDRNLLDVLSPQRPYPCGVRRVVLAKMSQLLEPGCFFTSSKKHTSTNASAGSTRLLCPSFFCLCYEFVFRSCLCPITMAPVPPNGFLSIPYCLDHHSSICLPHGFHRYLTEKPHQILHCLESFCDLCLLT